MRLGSRALLLLVMALAFGVSDCSDDPTGAGSGGLALELRTPLGRPAADGDSVSIWIEDIRGDLLSGPARVAWGNGESGFDVSLDVPEGNARRVWASLDVEGWQGRGLLALGSRGGVRVRAATLTEVMIDLVEVVPRLSPVVADPGDLEYRVHWTRVPGAERYELREMIGDDLAVYVTPDTSRSFPLLPGVEARYRVRAQLELGASIYTDSVVVDRARLADLPRIVALEPSDGAIDVLDETVPRLTFDRAMDWSTLLPDQVRIVEAGSGQPIALQANGAPAEAELFLGHAEAFERGKFYRIEVDPGLRDFEGRPFDQNPQEEGLQGFSSRFGSEIYAPLFVTGVTPADSAEAVAISAPVTLTFNRAFDPASIDEQSIRLLDETGSAVACTRQLEATSVALTPEQDLGYDLVYRVEVTTAVRDLRGEPLDQDPSTPIPIYEGFSSSFRVESQPIGPLVSAVTPMEGESNAASFATIEIEFSREVDPATISVPTTFAVRKLPIQANIAGVLTADGSGRRFTFRPSAPLEAATRYWVVVTTGVHDLEGIPLDQDPSTPGFQPFQSEFRVERTIQVSATVPAANANRVPVSQIVSVQLSSAIDPASVNESSLRLERGGQPVESDRSVSSDARTALLTPHDPLARFTPYTVRVTPELIGADGGRLDQDLGQTGYQEFSIRFTTQPESIPPMVTAVLPPDGSSGVPARPPIEVEFNKPVLPASVNDETLLLRTVANGSLVGGTRIVAADSTSASFQPFFDLSLSTEYEIEVTNWVVDRFDVRLDQDPIAPDRQGFKSRFQTDHEHVSPRVAAIAPADSATEVPLDTVVEIDFDEPIAAATVSGIEVRDEAGQIVPGTLSLGNGDARVTFQPAAPLLLLRRYEVSVDTTVTDRVGNPLDQNPETEAREPFLSRFWTEGDRLGPRIVAVTPADESEGVDRGSAVQLGFSEPIDPATITDGVVLIDSLGIELAVQIEVLSPDSLALIPADLFEFAHRYTVSVAPTIADTAGNPLDQIPETEPLDPFVSHFVTQAENIRPTVTNVRYDAPPGERPPVTTRIWIAFSEPIDPTSLDDGDVLLSDDDDAVATFLTFSAPETLRIEPGEPLGADTRHELTVLGLSDLAGNPFDQIPGTEPLDRYETAFETEQDTEPPRVLSTTPVDGSEGVPAEQIVTVTFSEPMDSSTVDPSHLQLVRIDGSLEFPVSGSIAVGPDLTEFLFLPENPLLRGFMYEIRADFFLEDLGGNPLDQNPDTPQTDVFVASFLVGSHPVADAGDAVCDPADSSAVHVDGSDSFDLDGSIVNLVWRWGDGTETEIDFPAPTDFVQDHVYACSDLAGCDGLDNDGDGESDETDLCDESYQIVLRVRDETGLSAADTIGVSFCAFLARTVEPMDGATGVDTLLTEARLTFSRPVDPAVLIPAHFRLLEGGVDTGRITAAVQGADAREVVLTIAGPLAPATTYEISADTTVVDPDGRSLDQDLCAPGLQPFTSGFTTISPAP